MNKEVISKLETMRKHFGWDKTDTIEFMTHSLKDEAIELVESLEEQDDTAFQKELADVLCYALAICLDKGYDINAIMLAKIDEVMTRDY